jgi:hypothetical protein
MRAPRGTDWPTLAFGLFGLMLAVVVSAASAPAAVRPPQAAVPRTAAVLLELASSPDAPTLGRLLAAGGTLVEHDLHIWRVPAPAAKALARSLARDKLIRRVERDRTFEALSAQAPTTRQPGSEWWLRRIGAAAMTPPGPGKPVTVIDTGIEVGNADFVGKQNITLLNAQHGINLPGDFHGTAVSSLIAGQGVHVLGVYPRAALREWDATRRGQLSLSAIIGGVDAAIRAGPSVINMSLGGPIDDPMLRAAVLDAIHRGSLVVAAQGEDRFDGSPPAFPADELHVLAVVASDRHNVVYLDSNGSEANDLSSPGVGVEVAVPASANPSGHKTVTGNSFAAALVSAAASWIWTLRPTLDPTQLYGLLIKTARRIANGPFNTVSGYGLIDLQAALSAPAPPAAPYEPNDDVAMVEPGGLFPNGEPLSTSPTRDRAFVRGDLYLNQNPRDVFRVWIPARGSLTVSATPGSDPIELHVWDANTRTVLAAGLERRRHLLAAGEGTGSQRLRVVNGSPRGRVAYVEVSIGQSQTASYSLTMSTSRSPSR